MGEAIAAAAVGGAASAATSSGIDLLTQGTGASQQGGGIATGFGGTGGSVIPPSFTETQRLPTTQTLQRRSQSNTLGAPDSQRALQSGLLRRRLQLLRG